MNEPRLEDLLARIAVLEREKQRWKAIGLGTLVVFVLFLMAGGLVVTGAFVAQARAMQAAQAERLAAEAARYQEAVARQQAEQERLQKAQQP